MMILRRLAQADRARMGAEHLLQMVLILMQPLTPKGPNSEPSMATMTKGKGAKPTSQV